MFFYNLDQALYGKRVNEFGNYFALYSHEYHLKLVDNGTEFAFTGTKVGQQMRFNAFPERTMKGISFKFSMIFLLIIVDVFGFFKLEVLGSVALCVSWHCFG